MHCKARSVLVFTGRAAGCRSGRIFRAGDRAASRSGSAAPRSWRALARSLAHRRYDWSGQRGRRRAHRRMRASRMPTSNRPWRAFSIRWCCCRPRCSGGSNRAQLNAVLAHEHEHIARNDKLKDNLHRLVETLFWFHPARLVDRPADGRGARTRLRRRRADARPRRRRLRGRHPRRVPALPRGECATRVRDVGRARAEISRSASVTSSAARRRLRSACSRRSHWSCAR